MPDTTDTTPPLRELVGGKFAAVCVRCVIPSFPVPATTGAEAWQELRRHGWQVLPAKEGSAGGLHCPQCAALPPGSSPKPEWKPRRKR